MASFAAASACRRRLRLTRSTRRSAVVTREAGGGGCSRDVGSLDHLPPSHRGALALAYKARDLWSTQRAKSLLAACRALCVRASAAAAHMLLLFNTTRARARTTSGPPSTGAAIAAAAQHNAHNLRTPKHGGRNRIDGGMAGTTC